MIIQDAAALWVAVAATDREASYYDSTAGHDMKDAEHAGRSRHRKLVSPSFASASVWRSEPGPLSFVLMTVMVAAYAAIAIAQSSAKEIRGN